eukprot:784187-Pelagomonas_calceolata.AAC.1
MLAEHEQARASAGEKRNVASFNGGAHSDDEAGQSYKAVAAGGIVVCICNYIHLFVFGMREVEETAGQPVVHVEQ